MVNDIYDENGKEINGTNGTELCDLQENYQEELSEVKRRIKNYKNKLRNEISCFDRKKRKKFKKKIKKWKKKKSNLQQQIDEIKRRVNEHDESITLIIRELLPIREFYHNQLIQKIAESDNPREIKNYLSLIDGDDRFGK